MSSKFQIPELNYMLHLVEKHYGRKLATTTDFESLSVLIDFSVADSDSHFILKGNAGTARYASPEQIECRRADFRSDIFSIGVLLSEMSGSRHFRKVARKCMKKDPDKRYSDIDRLEDALFSPSNYGLGAIAALVATAAIIAGIWFLTRPQAEEEYVDSEAIDEIFRQATDLVEESGLNP